MMSGILHGIETGWFSAEIAEAAFAYQQKLEKGEKKVVGVNCYPDTVGQSVEILRVSHQVERDQAAELARRRTERNGAAVDRALAAIVTAARSSGNMIRPILAAAQVEATLGEICGVLRDEWGVYSESPVF
jgi:methylmalonyl-CoA mutase N-terminal domain/subunit